jgi:hypothetical protein
MSTYQCAWDVLCDPQLWKLLLGFGLVWFLGLALSIWYELKR